MSSATATNRVLRIPEPVPAIDPALLDFLTRTPEPTIAINDDDAVVFVNAAAAQLFDAAEAPPIGARVETLFQDQLRSRVLEDLARLRDPDRPDAAGMVFELIGRKADESLFPCRVAAVPHEHAGTRHLICTIYADATDENIDSQLCLREARLNYAQRIAQIGNWEWNLVSGSDWWSDELYKMLGVDRAQNRPCYDLFFSMIHEDDRPVLEKATRQTLETGAPHALDVRVVLRDGTEKVLHSQGEVHLDADGNPARVSGTLQDVTDRKTKETMLREISRRYEDAQRIARISSWEWDIRSGNSWWSREMYTLMEEDPKSYSASFENFIRKVHPDDQKALIEAKESVDPAGRERNANETSPGATLDIRILLPGNRRKLVELLVEVLTDDQGRPVTVYGTMLDVTSRRQLERQLRDSEERYSSTVELAALGIAHVDLTGRFIWSNTRLREMLGYTGAELSGLTVKDVSHVEDATLTDADRELLYAGKIESIAVEKRYIRKDGALIWVRISTTLRRGPDGEPLYEIATFENISDRKAAEDRIQYLATHDDLTDLPNRLCFNELAAQAIRRAARESQSAALLYIDLDRVKVINDDLGHHAGDVLLSKFAERLKSLLRDADITARLGGDEFAVFLPRLQSADEPSQVAERILDSLREPMELCGQECRSTASIGIARYPEHGKDVATLLRRADAAMYSVKHSGRGDYRYFSSESRPGSSGQLALELQLGHAIERGELHIDYQPRVNLHSGRIVGAEALIRWLSPTLGAVAPDRFIPLAEECGMIGTIGRWVLRTACEQFNVWTLQGLGDVHVSVNLSPLQFSDPKLLDDIEVILRETAMDPRWLELEITEGAIMRDVASSIARIDALRSLGVSIAIDDFGEGYSSFAQLKRFPIDTLKMDRSFIVDVPRSARDVAITDAIIALGRALGVKVVAEGVENAAQYEYLRARDCSEAQGFHIARPCSADDLAELLSV